MVKEYSSTTHLLTVILLLLFSSKIFAADIQVYADRDSVSLNESFQLIYEAKGSVDDDPDFSVLKPYVDILNESQSSNVSIVNGNYSSSKTWTLSVMAKKAGSLNLPAVSFGSDKSMTLNMQVNSSSSTGNASEDFFTRIEISPEQAYVQQQIIVKQSLFSNKNLSAYSLGELDFNGQDVVVESLGKENQYQTRIGNRAFLVVEKRYAIFPQVAGQLVINPSLAEARTASSSSSLFDPFGRNGKVVRARTQQKIIMVKPVPLDANMSPWLPANDLEITESWAQNPPVFIQGEPLTRTISIKADGLTAAQLPEIPEPVINDMKMYPDQPMIKDVTNDTGITGYRIEKTAFIPTRAGKVTLPAIEIPWWDTRAEKRRVLRIAGRTIDVRAAVVDTANQQVLPAKKAPESTPQESYKALTPAPELLAQSSIQEVQSGPWKILAIVFAIAWLLTVGALILTLRKFKRSANEVDVTEAAQSVSIKSALKQVESSCREHDRQHCRNALISWAQLVFDDDNILGLSAVIRRIPDDMASEVKKIDFALYAGDSDKQVNIIDYDRIAQCARDLTNSSQRNSRNENPSQLEPLYKI